MIQAHSSDRAAPKTGGHFSCSLAADQGWSFGGESAPVAAPPAPAALARPHEEQSIIGLASFAIGAATWLAMFIGGLAAANPPVWMVVAASAFCGSVLGVVALLVSQRPKHLAGIGGIANLLAFLIVAGTVAGDWISDGALGWSWTPLGKAHAKFSAAVLAGDLDAARAEATANPQLLTHCKKHNTKLLQKAVMLGTKAEIVRLLAKEGGADFDALTDRSGAEADYRQVPPLVIAVRKRDQAVASTLLQVGADPRNLSEGSASPLGIALFLPDMKMAQLLAAEGMPRIAEEIDGQLPHAIRAKNESLVIWLLDHGANIDLATPAGTPLIIATDLGEDRLVDLFLARKASPNLVCAEKTPLSAAVTNRRAMIADRLLKAGADPNYFLNDSKGHQIIPPPLHRALELRNREMAELLLVHKADPNMLWPGDIPLTPLECAGSDDDLVELLTKHGAKAPQEKPGVPDRPKRKRKKKDKDAPLAVGVPALAGFRFAG